MWFYSCAGTYFAYKLYHMNVFSVNRIYSSVCRTCHVHSLVPLILASPNLPCWTVRMWSCKQLVELCHTTLQHHLCMVEDQGFYMHATNLLYWQFFRITGQARDEMSFQQLFLFWSNLRNNIPQCNKFSFTEMHKVRNTCKMQYC